MAVLRYRTQGSGNPFILLHGFCECNEIWNPVLKKLSGNFQLILPDLPGHGKTPLNDQILSLGDVAQSVLELIEELGLQEPVIMGHSMGGYVTLSAVQQRPELFSEFGLIHSTAYADSDEKKENRNKSIEFVLNNGADAFFDVFVPGLYHKEGPWISEVDQMIRKTPRETVIRYTEMMRDRPERIDIVKSWSNEILFVGGDMDSFISAESLENQAKMADKSVLHILPETGHLSMFEDPDKLAEIILDFTD
ncbi:MAG: alpha/beta hydrolase [Cyclobacteriaceae bacterium]